MLNGCAYCLSCQFVLHACASQCCRIRIAWRPLCQRFCTCACVLFSSIRVVAAPLPLVPGDRIRDSLRKQTHCLLLPPRGQRHLQRRILLKAGLPVNSTMGPGAMKTAMMATMMFASATPCLSSPYASCPKTRYALKGQIFCGSSTLVSSFLNAQLSSTLTFISLPACMQWCKEVCLEADIIDDAADSANLYRRRAQSLEVL